MGVSADVGGKRLRKWETATELPARSLKHGTSLIWRSARFPSSAPLMPMEHREVRLSAACEP